MAWIVEGTNVGDCESLAIQGLARLEANARRFLPSGSVACGMQLWGVAVMNLSLSHLRVHTLDQALVGTTDADEPSRNTKKRRATNNVVYAGADDHSSESDTAQIRRLRSLLALFALYATALFVVILFSDGPDIGCILTGIAGHVLYASAKTAMSWREATWLESARLRLRQRRRAAFARA